MAEVFAALIPGLFATIRDAIRGDQDARRRLADVVPEQLRGELEEELDRAALAAKWGDDD